MIQSLLPGRVRIKLLPYLSRERIEQLLVSYIAKGLIYEWSYNSKTGSLLIMYNQAKVKVDEIISKLKRAGFLLESFGTKKIKILNISLLITLAVSILSIILGYKGLHTNFGILFLMLLIVHLYRHRKIIITSGG